MSDALAGFAFLTELESDERDALWDVLERCELDAGATLFAEGDPADGLILVERGQLRLTSRRAGALGTVGAGHALGAGSLAGPGRREATAEATSPARVYVLSRHGFRGLLQTEPRAACKLAEAALREITEAVRGRLDHLSRPRS